MILAVDLGQTGSRYFWNGNYVESPIGKLAGQSPIEALEIIFNEMPGISCETVALSLTGLSGNVTEQQIYAELCHKYFGANQTLIIDDGLAGHLGFFQGGTGVTILAGSGVVCIASREGIYSHKDGLGSIFGDEGGGYWLGKLGLTRALAAEEGRDSNSELLKIMAGYVNQFHNLESKNGPEAALLAISAAKGLLEAADLEIPTAIQIREGGARLLAQTIASAWAAVGGEVESVVNITFSGGLSGNKAYSRDVERFTSEKLPSPRFSVRETDNLSGAIWAVENHKYDIPPLMSWFRKVS